jgi:hypothetical protein
VCAKKKSNVSVNKRKTKFDSADYFLEKSNSSNSDNKTAADISAGTIINLADPHINYDD